MLKRYTAIVTTFIFIITMFPFVFMQKVHAYQNNSYFNDLKVGLQSMSSTTATVTLNGEYTINGQVYPSGSVLNLGINSTSITFNGTLQTQISLVPKDNTNLLTITAGSVTNKYMGSFLFKIYNGKILPINTLDIENYLKGVVGYEMSDNFPIEALKTQAVAARNYALSRIGYETAKGYDFDDTINYQVYKGYNSSYSRVIAAVDQTKGQVLLYNDKLVETLYSAWHGGVSENSENVWGNYVPYMRSVVDSYENDSWPNGNRIFTNTQIQSTLVTKGYLTSTDTFVSLDLNSITKFTSGRVSNINIIYKNSFGLTQTKSVTKDSTRTFLSLPSNLYTVTYDSVSNSYTFSGKGNGHGLGLSQIGAKNRAAAGQTYDQILKFYFQNTYLQNLILKATLNTLSQSSNALFTGNTISFNSTAGSGNGYGYFFKYVIKNGSNVVLTKDYSSVSSLDFTPNSIGSYTIEAYVKDKFSISEYDDKKVSTFNVYGNPVLSSFTTNKTETLVNQGVAANATVESGSGSYLYKYDVTKDGNTLASRDFSGDKQFIYTPSQAGNYTITTYVKDSISTKDYDFKQSQNLAAYDSLTVTSFTKDDENVFVGDNVNFSTSVNGGSNKGVKYKYEVVKDGQSVFIKDFDVSSNFIYSPNKSGNYEVTVYAVDSISESTYDVVNKMNFTVKDRASITSLNLDRTTAFVNDTVTINTENSITDALYKFVVLKDGVVVFTKDYDTNSSLQYMPTLSGNYVVQVYTKDNVSAADYDDMKSLQFVVYDYSELSSAATDKSQYLAGQTITLNTAATLGSGNYLYKYVISKDGTALTTKDYSSEMNLKYTAVAAGSYTITVYIKDVLSTKDFDDMKVLNILVNSKPSMNFVSSQTSTLVGNSVNYSITEIDGSGKAQYRFLITKDNNLISDSGYSSINSFTFIPDTAGNYQVVGYMKDELSENEFDTQNTLGLSVYNPQLGAINVNGYFYEGKPLNFNASSIGASPSGFTYKYEIYSNLTLIASSNFYSTSTFTFTPAISGNYSVKVYGKDGLSSNSYDSLKQFNITINSKPLYLSTLPLSVGITSNDVASLQTALITLGYNVSSATGYFGTQTKSAVISFQKNKGLTADGIVGNATYKALNDTLIEKTGIKSLTF